MINQEPGDRRTFPKGGWARHPAASTAAILLLSILILIAASFSVSSDPVQQPALQPEGGVTIPAPGDWLDCGPIFTAGATGDWDRYLWGGFTNTVVKKNGTYYLYYQGASGYDQGQGTVTWRAIGVATSSDGLNFSKYAQNPVLNWFPNNHFEEGAVSAGAFLNGSDIALYYGANTWVGGSGVTADGRFATSSNGFNFTDQGVILDHNNTSIWGSGDELFPIISFQHQGQWFTYYIPNGTPQEGLLGVAWGNSSNGLTNSAQAQTGASAIPVWGPGGFAEIGANTYALFLNDLYAPGGHTLEVRTVSTNTPTQLSQAVETYQFANVRQATVLLDEENNRWLMYYRSAEQEYYGVMVAPAAGGSVNCGTLPPPGNLRHYTPIITRTGRGTDRPVIGR